MTMLWLTLYDGPNMLIKNSRDVESGVVGGCGGCNSGWVGSGWCWWQQGLWMCDGGGVELVLAA